MRGVDSKTGKELAGIDHLRQSVRDIIRTPIGSRVGLREYGSQVFALIDAPMNRSTVVDIVSAVVDALARWEPRIEVLQVTPSMPAPGELSIGVRGIYKPDGTQITIDGIIVK